MIETEILAAVYVRSLGTGMPAIYRVSDQREKCEAKAEELGAEPAGLYIEYDILRPELDKLLNDISDGQTRYVIVTESAWDGIYSELRQQVERQITASGATLVICDQAN